MRRLNFTQTLTMVTGIFEQQKKPLFKKCNEMLYAGNSKTREISHRCLQKSVHSGACW